MIMRIIKSDNHYDKYKIHMNSEEAVLTAYGPYTDCNLITIHKDDEEVYRINYKRPYPHSFIGEYILGGQLSLNKDINFLKYLLVTDKLNSLPSDELLMSTNLVNPQKEITHRIKRRIETYSTLAKIIFGFD